MSKKLTYLFIALSSMICAITSGAARATDPIHVGAILPMTGPASYIGDPEAKTLAMIVEQINAKGGLLGRQIKTTVYDDHGDPAAAMSHVKRLIEVDRADVILGTGTSGSSLAILPVAERAGIPLISLAGAEPIIRPAKPWIFKTPQTDRMAAGKIFADMKGRGIAKIALLSSVDGFGKSFHDVTLEVASGEGISIVADETYFPNDVDMSAQLAKIRSNPAVQAVLAIGAGAGPAILTKNYRQLGITLPLYQSHAAASQAYVDMAGAAAEGVRMPASAMLVAHDLDAADPQRQLSLDYVQAYQGKYGAPPPTFGGHVVDAMNILVDAINRAKTTDKPQVRAAIEHVRNLPGTAGVINMSEKDHLGLDASTAFRMVEVREGKWRLAK